MAIRFLLEGEESGGSVAVFEFDVPAGAKLPPPTSTTRYEETIYGLQGVLTWTLDGPAGRHRPGRGALHPRGVIHRFDNKQEADASALAIVTPASSARATSSRSPPSSGPRPADRPTRPRWAR